LKLVRKKISIESGAKVQEASQEKEKSALERSLQEGK